MQSHRGELHPRRIPDGVLVGTASSLHVIHYYYHDNQYYQIPDTDQSATWLGFFGMGYNYPPPLPEPPEDAYDPLLEGIPGQPPSGGGTGGDLNNPSEEEMKYLCETGFLGVKKRTEPGQPTFPTRDSDYDIFFNFNFSEVSDWHTQKYEYDSAGRMTKSTFINDSVNLPNVLEYDLNGRVTKKEYRDATSLLNTHSYEYSEKGFISKVKINAAEYDITTNANGCITGNDLSGYDFTYNEYNQLATGTKRDWIPITFKDKNGLTWTTAYKPSFIDQVDAFWRWIHGERRWIIDTSGYPPPHEWAGPSGETWDFMTRRLFYAGGVMVQDEWENKNPMVDGSNWCVPDDEADKSLVPKYYRVNEDYSGQPSPDNLWLHYNYHNGRNISWDWGFDLSDWSMSRRERVTYDKLGTPQKTYKSDSWDDSKTVNDLSGSQRSPDANSPAYSEADSVEDQVFYTLGPSGMIDSFVEQMEQIKWDTGSKLDAAGSDTISGKMFYPNHGFGAAMWQGGIWLPFMPAPPGLIPPLPGGTVRTPPSSASEQYEHDHGKTNWVVTPSIEWDLKPVPARPNCDPGFNPKPYYGPGSDRMSADFMGGGAYNNPNFGLPSDGGGSFIGLGRFDSACNIPNDMQPDIPSGGLFGPDFGIGLWGFPGYDPDWRHVPGGWIYSPDLPTMPLYFFPDDMGMLNDPMPALPSQNPGLPGLNVVPGSMTVTDAPAGWGKATWKERQPRLLGSSGGLLSRIGNAIKSGWNKLKHAVSRAAKAVGNAVRSVVNTVSAGIQIAVKSVSATVKTIGNSISKAYRKAKETVSGYLSGVGAFWTEEFGRFFSGEINDPVEWALMALVTAGGIAALILSGYYLASVLPGLMGTIGGWISGIGGAIAGWFWRTGLGGWIAASIPLWISHYQDLLYRLNIWWFRLRTGVLRDPNWTFKLQKNRITEGAEFIYSRGYPTNIYYKDKLIGSIQMVFDRYGNIIHYHIKYYSKSGWNINWYEYTDPK
jgi:hypothetical protein